MTLRVKCLTCKAIYLSQLRDIAQVPTSFCYYTLSMLPWYALVMLLSVAMTNESQAKKKWLQIKYQILVNLA